MSSQQLLHRAGQLSLLATSLYALVSCPYSKVEESFQLQATHDLYYLGMLPPSHTELPYDHLSYPGVVPRTFMGPLILAGCCRALTILCHPFLNLADHPTFVMFLARLLLWAVHLHAWYRLAKKVGGDKGSYLLLLTAAQFHIPYYSSRMLPNTFALILVLHSYSEWIGGSIPRAAVALVAATTIFRCDLLLLLFTCGLTWLVRGDLSIPRALYLGIVTGTVCLAVIVPYDSHMWQKKWVWAEGQVFYYNTVLGKSKDWGVSPWHWYVSSALPKALLLTLLLIPMGVLRLPELLVHHASPLKTNQRPPLVDTSLFQYLLPILGFVGLYSCLGHKEMRFLFPALPILNLVGAAGMARLHGLAFPAKDKSTTTWTTSWLWLGGVACMGVTLLASTAFVLVSQRNYPGGQALAMLLRHLGGGGDYYHSKVYIDNAAAMSGVSLFGQRRVQNQFPNIEFVKAGYEHDTQDYNDFDYVISEDVIPGMRVVAVSQGFPRLDIKKLRIATTDAIYVNERIDRRRSENK